MRKMDMKKYLSEYINKDDLEISKVWKIMEVNVAIINGIDKPQARLKFGEHEKTLTLNMTNRKILCKMFGTNTESWLNRDIVFTTIQVNYKGDIIDSITVDEKKTNDLV